MNILEALWNGDVCPISDNHYQSETYREYLSVFRENEKMLLLTLDSSQREWAFRMAESMERMRNLSECSAFINGFRLAVQIMEASVASR